MGIWYVTRDDVTSALGDTITPRDAAQVDRAIDAASRTVDGITHRQFWPTTRTRRFDRPRGDYARPWRIWLDAAEAITIDTITASGDPVTDYVLYPDDGPPYDRIEIDLDRGSSWSGTGQQAIAVTGTFGYPGDEPSAGALAAAVDDTASSITITDSTLTGVGALLRLGTERVTVTAAGMADTGLALDADLSAQRAADVVTVIGTGALHPGETILVDGERMWIVDVAGSTVVVKRSWDGSTLAGHSAGATVWAPRLLHVARAVTGTAPGAHDTGATVYRWLPPAPVRALTVALAIDAISQEQAAYGRTTGDTRPPGSGVAAKGLADQREDVYVRYGRKARVRAV